MFLLSWIMVSHNDGKHTVFVMEEQAVSQSQESILQYTLSSALVCVLTKCSESLYCDRTYKHSVRHNACMQL